MLKEPEVEAFYYVMINTPNYLPTCLTLNSKQVNIFDETQELTGGFKIH